VSDDYSYPGAPAPPPGASSTPPPASRRSSSGVTGWLIAAVVVLVLAIAGGLFTAWLVANMRAVPGPIAAASASPRPAASSCACSPSPVTSTLETAGPRRTPTALPTTEVTPEPFVYVVQPGDHLVNIADLYQVDIQDVMDLNNITNPNRISVGQQLLIPGYGVPPTPKPTKKPK